MLRAQTSLIMLLGFISAIFTMALQFGLSGESDLHNFLNMNKIILGMLLVLQALSLQVNHFNYGSSSLKLTDRNALIAFMGIGVLSIIVIVAVICCLARQNPEYRDSNVQQGQKYNHSPNYYEPNPNYYEPNPNYYDPNPNYYDPNPNKYNAPQFL